MFTMLPRYFEIVGVVSYGVGCNSTINGENIFEIMNSYYEL